MTKYVDKSAVVAELKRRLLLLENGTGDSEVMKRVEGVIKGYKSILSFLDTIELKEVGNTELLKVRGYFVRDKDDYTAIYAEKPHRGKTEWVNGNGSCLMTINDARLVPDIEFEDEPVEVEVTLETHCKEEAYNEVFSCLKTLEAKNVDLYRKIDKLIKK